MTRIEANALRSTNEIVDALELMISGNASLAIVYGNAARAAIKILFDRYAIDEDDAEALYFEIWQPVVAPMAEA